MLASGAGERRFGISVATEYFLRAPFDWCVVSVRTWTLKKIGEMERFKIAPKIPTGTWNP